MTRLPVAYLRPDAVAEPLFNRWYAWGYLIAPQTAAMFVAQAHLRLMRSFVSAPRVHAEALKNAALRGGAFLDCDASRVDDVRALADATERTSSDLLELAEGLRRLDELLAAHESGTSLEPLYERVPPALRGYVELVFDARHRATFRLFEALLYRSRYYDEARQSVGLSVEGECARPFVFSTPRLDAPGKLFLDVPFRDPALDALFRMRTRAGSVDAVAEALGVEGKEARSAFDAMFTAAPPAASAAPPPGPLRVRYLGHACVLIETPSCNVLVDPLVAPDGAGPGGRSAKP